MCDVSSPINPAALSWWHTSRLKALASQAVCHLGTNFHSFDPPCFCAKVRSEATHVLLKLLISISLQRRPLFLKKHFIKHRGVLWGEQYQSLRIIGEGRKGAVFDEVTTDVQLILTEGPPVQFGTLAGELEQMIRTLPPSLQPLEKRLQIINAYRPRVRGILTLLQQKREVDGNVTPEFACDADNENLFYRSRLVNDNSAIGAEESELLGCKKYLSEPLSLLIRLL